jgi:gliding motility-associated-like protein
VKKDCYIEMPNTFTPNGDDLNDYFFPKSLLSRGVTAFKMSIFNRWGQLIFETTNPEGRGWDGRWNGVMQPNGVYIYLLDATLKNGKTEHYQGNVTLLR